MVEEAPALERLREVKLRLLHDGTAAAPDGSIHSVFPVAISAAEGEALRIWAERERATKTIEIGLGYAISTLFICEALLSNGDLRGSARCYGRQRGPEIVPRRWLLREATAAPFTRCGGRYGYGDGSAQMQVRSPG